MHAAWIETTSPTICSESRCAEKNSGQRIWAFNCGAVSKFLRLLQFLHLEKGWIANWFHFWRRRQVHFLARPEVEALLDAPDQRTWFGRRDHAFLQVAAQTGLRLSEMTGLTRNDVTLSAGAHVRVIGKGRKERCVPFAKHTVAVLKAWLREPPRGDGQVLFPNARGTRLSPDGIHYLMVRHVKAAAKVCPSLKDRRVTVHCLRHTAAMDLLQEGVDRSVIALWLGHESVDTTQIYLEATLAMKEKALSKTKPLNGKFKRYRPGDKLLGFLNNL